MAAGDVQVIDNTYLSLQGTGGTGTPTNTVRNLSPYIAVCRLQITHVLPGQAYTMGVAGPLRELSDKYDWQLDVEFVTDGWGASELDGYIAEMLKAPLSSRTSGQGGARTGTLNAVVRPNSGSVGAANPQYAGQVILSDWEPLGGSGAINELVRQTRTMMGRGALSRTVSSSVEDDVEDEEE